MSYFRTAPNVLRTQREELESAHRDLCLAVAEIGTVARRLEAMSGFDGTLDVLRGLARKGAGQTARLRESAGVLGQVAELYTQAEKRGLEVQDGPTVSSLTRGVLWPVYQLWGRTTAPHAPERDPVTEGLSIRPAPMLPNAEALFGTKVLIVQRDREGESIWQ